MNKKSSLELMRIISMFFIVVYHIILHSNLINLSTGGTKFLLVLLEAFMVVHVNSFILLTGYFQSDKNAKFSKIISVCNATWFYKLLTFVGIILVTNYFSLPNNVDMNFHQKIISILPFDRYDNWYINCYLLTYIFSPYLNVLINKLSRSKLKKLIIILFIVFSLVGTILIGNILPDYNSGRCMMAFILLYFVGAYLRLYPIEESRLFSVYKPKLKKYVFLIGYILLGIIGITFRMTAFNISIYDRFYTEFSDILYMTSISFLSPLVLIQSISYFLFFKNMSFNSRVINFIGGTTFGIYLLHENRYIRDNLFEWLNMSSHANGGIKLVCMVILLGIIIFISCMTVEIIRKAIYKFFYKRKFALKLRNKVQDFIKSLGLDINY